MSSASNYLLASIKHHLPALGLHIGLCKHEPYSQLNGVFMNQSIVLLREKIIVICTSVSSSVRNLYTGLLCFRK